MILVNDVNLKIDNFPDATERLKYDPITMGKSINTITWRYEGEFECMTLWFITNHIKNHLPGRPLNLRLVYAPNARYDRVKDSSEVFTLKWFAEFINILRFTNVSILDPHSNVTTALIDRVSVESPKQHIQCVIDTIENNGFMPVLYFPDEGAMKRYSDMFKDYLFLYGEKKRDWKTGEIQGLNLRGNAEKLESIVNPNFLMIDDICSHGGTFYYSAKTLKEAFPNCYINSWATHTENDFPTLQKAFDEGLIVNHFTTNSLYSHTHNNIKVFYVC